ncbi:agmatinase [Paracholeplasma manati]|jgi:agmatinase|uniref:Agmatinase n=1 Tax=Paracholeplasma manati TaxID=591373 RepID=A0ABT2Y6I6_9MOLU|nr:agmatinase [Paracholeplasma manati]MCV2232358.1 agmatinase [Paracholeplasma manati]MDG0888057.1 agmatinase [Paracholeplasma manati]MDX9807589.1 agmatinase [Acholeplasma sp.]
MSFKKVDLSFQSCKSEYDDASVVIYSCPMDATTSYRPGTRFAGNAIRVDSFGIEWYSPYRDMSLKDYPTCDIGDLDLPIGAVEDALNVIYETTKQILKDNKKPMMIGGEHLVTLPVLQAVAEKYPDVHMIHLDAHTDLRDEFFGRKLSHATVIRRCFDVLGPGRIYQFGIRSGDKHEFEWAAAGNTFLRKFDFEGLAETIQKLKDKPVYITIDLDVLDPGVFPGTGTAEPGGMQYKDLLNAFDLFENLNNIVGADFVELNPYLDPSGASNAVAVKTLREMVLLLHR